MVPELDVVDESDQITHLLRLEDAGKTEDILSEWEYNFSLVLYGGLVMNLVCQ